MHAQGPGVCRRTIAMNLDLPSVPPPGFCLCQFVAEHWPSARRIGPAVATDADPAAVVQTDAAEYQKRIDDLTAGEQATAAKLTCVRVRFEDESERLQVRAGLCTAMSLVVNISGLK